jgi:hypothetical protein
MEPESSLPSSQKPATGPYPEPDESSAQLLTMFPEDTLLILSSHLLLGLSSGLFRFPTEILYAFLISSPPISSSLMWSP